YLVSSVTSARARSRRSSLTSAVEAPPTTSDMSSGADKPLTPTCASLSRTACDIFVSRLRKGSSRTQTTEPADFPAVRMRKLRHCGDRGLFAGRRGINRRLSGGWRQESAQQEKREDHAVVGGVSGDRADQAPPNVDGAQHETYWNKDDQFH